MNHASTFSGIGGPEVAAAMLGWSNLFHCEINPFGRSVLQYWFPNSVSYDDITKTDFSPWRGRVDVLSGGFPCQPFSYAGKRRGSQDDRYLWPFMLRCIEQVQPSWFVGENVAGITTMALPREDAAVGQQTNLFGTCDDIIEKHERFVLFEIIQNLEHAGYSVQPFVIPACAVGAPHRRDRVFIVAHRNASVDATGHTAAHAESEQGDGLQSEQRKTRQQKSLQSGGRGGEGADQRQTPADTPVQRCQESDAATEPDKEERFDSRFDTDWRDTIGLFSSDRWRAFPSVSPVYRGNDGLPFPVDNLTILQKK